MQRYTLPCYYLFPTYPRKGSRLSPFSVVFALLRRPFVFKTIIVRSFAKKIFFATMTSADFLQFSCTSLHSLAGVNLPVLRPIARPPQLRTVTFLSYIRHIYTAEFGLYWTSLCLVSSSALHMPYM